MSQRQSHSQSSGLGQYVGDVRGQMQVVLELVDVDHHRRSLVGRHAHAPQSCLPKLRDGQRSEQGCSLRTDESLGERHEQDLALGEDGVKIKGRVCLADDGAHSRAQQEGPEFVHYRRDGLLTFTFAEVAPGRAEAGLSFSSEGVVSNVATSHRQRVKASPALVAISAADPDHTMLREDLAAKKGKDASDRQERGIAHLLALLGFRVVWWTDYLPKPAGAHQTGHDPDMFCISADDSTAFLVECSTTHFDPNKVAKLTGRTNEVKRKLKATFGDEAPFARPLVAMGQDRATAPEQLKKAARENYAGLMGLDDELALLAALEAGLPESEVMGMFEALFPLDRGFRPTAG